MITHSHTQDYFIDLVFHITEYLKPLGINVITTISDKNKEDLSRTLQMIYHSNVDGIILISCDYLSIKNSLDLTLPHVWIDCNDLPESCGDICTVQSDHFAGGQLAALELLSKGCKHPFILTSSSNSIRS